MDNIGYVVYNINVITLQNVVVAAESNKGDEKNDIRFVNCREPKKYAISKGTGK